MRRVWSEECGMKSVVGGGAARDSVLRPGSLYTSVYSYSRAPGYTGGSGETKADQKEKKEQKQRNQKTSKNATILFRLSFGPWPVRWTERLAESSIHRHR